MDQKKRSWGDKETYLWDASWAAKPTSINPPKKLRDSFDSAGKGQNSVRDRRAPTLQNTRTVLNLPYKAATGPAAASSSRPLPKRRKVFEDTSSRAPPSAQTHTLESSKKGQSGSILTPLTSSSERRKQPPTTKGPARSESPPEYFHFTTTSDDQLDDLRTPPRVALEKASVRNVTTEAPIGAASAEKSSHPTSTSRPPTASMATPFVRDSPQPTSNTVQPASPVKSEPVSVELPPRPSQATSAAASTPTLDGDATAPMTAQTSAAAEACDTQNASEPAQSTGNDASASQSMPHETLEKLLKLRESSLRSLTEEQLPEALRVESVRKMIERAAADIMCSRGADGSS
ncbi:unnamed protein product [Peniophora sp. CBMAI 1063]|nr:unnamed protein product [Peniophora sp. CBMAI 1063]